MNQQHGAYPGSAQVHPPSRQYAEHAFLSISNQALGTTAQDLASGSSLSTPLSPMFSALSQPGHGNTAMASRTYNPQQWNQDNNIRSSHMAFSPSQRSANEASGMEALMPSPPPPYTPPPDNSSRTLRPSPMVTGNTFMPSSLSIESSLVGTSSQHSTPPSGPPAHFPPPPNSQIRERSASGASRDPHRMRFSISGLAARVKRSDSSDQIASSSVPQAKAISVPSGLDSRPPASRRAASTGAILTHSARTNAPERVSPEPTEWQPGMPLPPPPPGPPPPGARSQSLNRYGHGVSGPHEDATMSTNVVLAQSSFAPARRRHEDTLGAIPPTPSDWAPDSDSHLTGYMELRVNTGQAVHDGIREASLSRRPAIKNATNDSIRERRSRSRAMRDGQDSIPQEIVSSTPETSEPTALTLATADGLWKRRRAAAAEPSSSQSSPAQSSSTEQVRRLIHGRNSVPVLTPPYTPSALAPPQQGPLHVRTNANGQSLDQQEHFKSPRTCFDGPKSAPPAHSQHLKPLVGGLSNELPSFIQASMERYHTFAFQEAASKSDQDKLKLFASFMVQESRIRRGHYAEAFKSMAGDIMELTRDMWRPLSAEQECHVGLSQNHNASSESVDIAIELDDGFRVSLPSTAELTPATDTESLADDSGIAPQQRPLNPWGDRFQPCLSPIPSMAVSTVPDEESSRGRSASRWWEESADGSMGNGGRRIERTKQETKYMSLHPQEVYAVAQPSPNQTTPTPGTSNLTFRYSSTEYPPKKVDLHEPTEDKFDGIPIHHSAALLSPRNKAPVGFPTDRPALDVTRLVTLPPPYPRHHPAVNNSHPALGAIRADHRAVSDLSSVRELVRAHEALETSRRQAWRTAAGERLRRFRAETQTSINEGRLSYSEASQSELTFRQSEAATVLSQAETQFYDFRQCVFEAAHQMLAERLQSCNNCILQLTKALMLEAQSDQNLLAQTEGDERPELVEQLTLLKWLFETREHIHKERFDIDVALQGRECAAVLTKYQQSRDDTRVLQIEQHFESERQKRQLEYARETKQRFDDLRKTVEQHVSRGVEIQLSAFWDIAPGLVEIVQRVPQDLHDFEILVPAKELAENRSYHTFPMQYMFSILNHAKKSAYQLIEAQINLLCLLHEVHTATASASLRLQEIERGMTGERTDAIQVDMAQLKSKKEEELTKDLQGKVGEVEGQWSEALGSAIEGCIGKIKLWLQETGGWDQNLESLDV